MADEQSTSTDDKRSPEKAVFTDLLLRSIVWNGPRVGPGGRLQKGTGGNLKPGQRRVVWDSWQDEHGKTTGLSIQITEKGAKSFQVTRRVKGEPRPVKVTLGRFDQGDMTLAEARAKAQDLKKQMRAGTNPAAVRRQEQAEKKRQDEEERLAELRRTTHTVKAVAERYIAEALSKLRSGTVTEQTLRRDIIPAWGGMAIQDVTRKHVTALLNSIKADPERRRTGKVSYAAQHALSATSALFAWAIAQDEFDGLEVSPTVHVESKNIIGRKTKRDRILTDDELRTFWLAVHELPYPWSSAYKLLLLSASRLREITDLVWPEVTVTSVQDDDRKAQVRVDVLAISESRMKGKLPHLIPLTPAMKQIIEDLPRFNGGDYLFSCRGGRSPLTGMGQVKNRLDRAMVSVLRRGLGVPEGDKDLRKHLGLTAGEPIPADYCIKPFVNHDLRRTARSLMSRAGVASEVAERCLAHVEGGIVGTYDRFDFLLPKRAAYEALDRLVGIITSPPADNVVDFPGQRATA